MVSLAQHAVDDPVDIADVDHTVAGDVGHRSIGKGFAQHGINHCVDIDDVAEKAARYEQIKLQLDDMELRWLELSEKG